MDCSAEATPIGKSVCEFEARDALPKESVTGQPTRYDITSDESLAIVPRPAPGTIEIDVDATKFETIIKNGLTYHKANTTEGIGWNGNIRDGDGDVISYDGKGESRFHVKCLEGQQYALTFNKIDAVGELKIDVYDHEGSSLNDGVTDAAYGSVTLVGECEHD
jgi:hypothetical protein